MTKKPPSVDINIPEASIELSMETRRVTRVIRDLNSSITSLKNGLHELLGYPPINALYLIKDHRGGKNFKGGFEPFSKLAMSTRDSILRLINEFGFDKSALEGVIKKSKVKSNSGLAMLRKLRRGMTGVCNTIPYLLDKGEVRVTRRIYLKSHSAMDGLKELADLYRLLEIFITEDREAMKKFFKQFQST